MRKLRPILNLVNKKGTHLQKILNRSYLINTGSKDDTTPHINKRILSADLAQLGERQTEDLKVLCSIHKIRILVLFYFLYVFFGYHVTI